MVANLALGLTQLGHEVTVFASGDSHTPARLFATVPCALRLSPHKIIDSVAFHAIQLGQVARMANEFDVIHNHMDYLMFQLARSCPTPVVTTMHGRLDHAETAAILNHYDDVPLVSISDYQRRPVPNAHWVSTIYHGLPLGHLEAREEPGSYLAFLGRISPEKRPDWAIAIARQSGVPLKIAAKVDPADRDYYETEIKPLIDGKFIEYIGEIGEHEKSEFLGNALGMVFPIDWPEPFGIAPIEAMACGTPVLARPCGSVPEIHRDGLSGFVRASVSDLASCVSSLASLDRRAVRRYAEERFSLLRMCEDYCHVYKQLIRQRGAGDGQRPSGVTKRPKLQLGESHGYRRSVLHSIRSFAAGNPENHIKT